MTDRKLGNMEREAHGKYPRYHLGTPFSSVPCCRGPHVGRAERETANGILRVTYTDSLGWGYELNGRVVTREAASAALKGAAR
jgi:hypothetical protein